LGVDGADLGPSIAAGKFAVIRMSVSARRVRFPENGKSD
jgi:hypothetical protein